MLEKSSASIDLPDDGSYFTQTISVLIKNDDRVLFRIERGSVVKYAISDSEAQLVQVGSDVELLISSYSSVARVIARAGSSPL
jgi:hypothetical protein